MAAVVRVTVAPNPLTDSEVVDRSDGVARYRGLEPCLAELLDRSALRHRSRVAAIDRTGTRVTYHELWATAARVAGGLLDQGVGPADRVIVAMPNSLTWIHAFLGVVLAGAVPVLPDPSASADEVTALAVECDAVMVLDRDVLPQGVAFLDDGASPEETAIVYYVRTDEGGLRGVALTNENVLSATEAVVHAMAVKPGGPNTIVTAPLASPIGCSVQLLPTLAAGATVVAAGAPQVRAPWRRMRAAFPSTGCVRGWGVAETGGIGLLLPFDLHARSPRSLGVPFGGLDVALVGPDAARGRGELLCRGPSVAAGYWRDAAGTAERFADGWFRTGEQVRIDEDGLVTPTRLR